MQYRDQNSGDTTPNFEQMLKTFFETAIGHVWTSLPGIVQSFDAEKQTAAVYPAIKQKYETEDGTIEERPFPVLQQVPVQFPRGGGFAVTFPLIQGDTGMLIFADRCITDWLIQGGLQSQAVRRAHDLSDAVFIPGVSSRRDNIPDFNASGAEIRNLSNDSVVTVSDDAVTVKNNTEVKIETPQLKLNDLNLGTHRHADPQGGFTGPPVN